MKYYGSKYVWIGIGACAIGQLIVILIIIGAIYIFVQEMRYQDVLIATHSHNVALQWEAIDELKEAHARAMLEMATVLHDKKLEKLRVVGEDGSYVSIILDPALEDFIATGVKEVKMEGR